MKTNLVKKISLDNDTLRIGVDDRIDINNASEVESDINEIISNEVFDSLILDLSNLYYISSVGIRVLIKLSKANKNSKIENVIPEVFEILEMTGIKTIIPVSKKLRELSTEGLEQIGAGFNGAVYRIDDETIVKVINDVSNVEGIQKERDLSQKLFY